MALPQNWAQAILRGIGAPVTQQNLRFLAAWQRAEGGGTANAANFNPLNTTQRAAGAGSINSVGVRSYRSGQQGIRATVQTLLNGHYGDIVSGLRSGRASAVQLAHSGSLSTWGTGGGVLRVLGSGGSLSPAPGAPAGHGAGHLSALGSPPGANGGGTEAFRNLVASYLIQSSNSLAAGRPVDPNSILSLALARQQLQAQSPGNQLVQRVNGPAPAPGAPAVHGTVKYEGDLRGLNQGFLNKLSSAAAATGISRIRITSGYRSPAHNAAVGGVPHSNHTFGRAMDGYGLINGKWVPLGVALKNTASRYGLRSGDQPGFYHGGIDTVHVDDGYNVRH